jgi:sterol desaturase/sphingolipid hydroxylase (fatty acid hydroxylase superfamily)
MVAASCKTACGINCRTTVKFIDILSGIKIELSGRGWATLVTMDLTGWDVTNLRWFFSLAVLTLILAVEWVAPFRRPMQSKLEHASMNLAVYGGNSLIAQFVAGWILLVWSMYVTHEGQGLLQYLRVGPMAHVIISVILLDMIAYAIHRLYHRVPVLWRFHRAHHSDLDMDATTSIRFHLGEVILTTGLKGLSVWTLGVSPAGFVLSETMTLAAGLFSHANVRLPRRFESRLRWAIVTPTMHWIHHSRRPTEHNANLGAVFSAWDRVFGTYNMGVAQQDIRFGLDEYSRAEDVTFLRFCRMPFDKPCGQIEDVRARRGSQGPSLDVSAEAGGPS